MLEQAALAADEGEPLFDHVLVDDYQDTTFAAERLLAGLRPPEPRRRRRPGAHVFSFQGTTDVPFRRFAERFPGAAVELRRRTAPGARSRWRPGAPRTSRRSTRPSRASCAGSTWRTASPWRDLAVVVRRHGPHLAGLLRALDDARVPRAVPRAAFPRGGAGHLPVRARPALAAEPAAREELIESVLTIDLGRLSPAIARGLMRVAQAADGSVASALDHTDGLRRTRSADAAAAPRRSSARRQVAGRSVLDAFRILWAELPCSQRLVAAAEASPETRRELDSVVALSAAVAEAGAGADPSVQAFLEGLEAGEHGPGFAAQDRGGADAVQVLTAHGAAGREFDTVLVAGARRGQLPQPHAPRAHVRPRGARRRDHAVGAQPPAPGGRAPAVPAWCWAARGAGSCSPRAMPTRTSRPLGALALRRRVRRDVDRRARRPVRRAGVRARGRRRLAADARRPRRPDGRAAGRPEGLVALGVDPRRWWFQRDWTDTGVPLHETLRLSYSKLTKLENCELQYVLSDELGLGRPGGYHAWVGKTVHKIIEEVRARRARRASLGPITAEVDLRWRPQEFPSIAVSEAYRYLAKTKMLKNWFDRYAEPQPLAIEQYFEFEFEDATIVGYIDRIGPPCRAAPASPTSRAAPRRRA